MFTALLSASLGNRLLLLLLALYLVFLLHAFQFLQFLFGQIHLFFLAMTAIADHEWGLYVINDNNLKWNKYAGVDLREALGDDFIDIYGEQCKIKLWIYPAGGPEGTVSVSEILVLNTK